VLTMEKAANPQSMRVALKQAEALRVSEGQLAPFRRRLVRMEERQRREAEQVKLAEGEMQRRIDERQLRRVLVGVPADETEMKQRRSRLGGQTGRVTISLMWDTACDLDLHLFGGPQDVHISSATPGPHGGCQFDLDANLKEAERLRQAATNVPITPAVENMFFRHMPAAGKYLVRVDNFHSRKRGAAHFEVIIEHEGKAHAFEGGAPPSPPNEQMVTVAMIEVDKEGVFTLHPRDCKPCRPRTRKERP